MKKRILVLLALIMSVLFVSCGSSGDNVKDALNDTSIFSQEEINYVNSVIEEMKQYGYNVTSKTINSTTMQVSGNYSYEDEGKTVSGTFSDKIEKKNNIVIYTSTNSNSSNSYVDYELTIPRVFGEYTNNDGFAEDIEDLRNLFDSTNPSQISGFSSIGNVENNSLTNQLTFYTNSYKGYISKMNGKYYYFDSTGIISTETTLSTLINNTKTQARINEVLGTTAIFSQEDIDLVNNFVTQLENNVKFDFTVSSKTINSTTMEIELAYNNNSGGQTIKIEKKNGLIMTTSTDSEGTEIWYSLNLSRAFAFIGGIYTNEDYFLSTSKDTLKTLLNNNGFEEFNTMNSQDEDNNYIQLDVLLYASQNSYDKQLYNGFIEKMNNKYYFYDSTGIIASENTLEALISNTNVKAKLQAELNKIN